jgi:cytochrome b involved in lipid metabolism
MTVTEASIPDKMFAIADLKNHTSEKSCWIVVHGKVYDVTDFLEEHPGGYDIILTVTGVIAHLLVISLSTLTTRGYIIKPSL